MSQNSGSIYRLFSKSSFFFLADSRRKKAFSHSAIHIGDKAQYVYLYPVTKNPYFCKSHQKTKLNARKKAIKRTAVLEHTNRLKVDFYLRFSLHLPKKFVRM